MLETDRVGVIDAGTGDNTVERLVETTMKTLDEATTLIFYALGTVPEDAKVELHVAHIICGSDAEVSAKVKINEHLTKNQATNDPNNITTN